MSSLKIGGQNVAGLYLGSLKLLGDFDIAKLMGELNFDVAPKDKTHVICNFSTVDVRMGSSVIPAKTIVAFDYTAGDALFNTSETPLVSYVFWQERMGDGNLKMEKNMNVTADNGYLFDEPTINDSSGFVLVFNQ